ncbi:MAG: DNA mismatch repair protein MutS [Caldilineaceae bacterium SB0675_bin_29]|uniref:DNA mismatch repair protein MutS n=1 Tax=Caldilineaceae bacterium SB0675_bin_29 TaxID=2605266 RepID=A0A6B1G759_9CHLR|nr:DNA mismatch repair protein MutS [Caldilineaceae bacterium SB0675_bin_29]
MTTPMRRQYLQLKSQHPDCILLFRLGDFYEAFDHDAEIVAEVCDVVLTSRPVGNNQRVPLAGVPYHSVEGYLAKLVEAGHKVAIAEQGSEPGSGLVDREIQQVITKGTIAEPSMLDDDRNNYLVAVLFSARGDEAGIAYCDITTGEFAVTQIDSGGLAETEQRLEEELARLRPSELVTSDWNAEESRLAPLISSLQALVSPVEAWQVEIDTARDALQRHLGVRSLDGFGLQERPQAVRAAAAILAYLQEMQPSALSQLVRLHSYAVSEFMVLDDSTRRNLELTETIRGADVRGSLLGVLDETLTPMGGRLLRSWLGRPLLDVALINERLEAVQTLVDETDLRVQIRDVLRGMGDLGRWINRITQTKALPRDLLGVREILDQAPGLRELFKSTIPGLDRGPEIGTVPRASADAFPNRMMARLPDCSPSFELLQRAIDDEPSATLANPGIIRPGYSEELDAIVENSRHAKEWVAALENVERNRLNIPSLKVSYNKVFGYYIEVRNTHAGKVPQEYIRKQTLTNAERYITPELKEYESQILNADERRLALEQELFRCVCADLTTQADEIRCLAEGLALLDVYASMAEVAVKRRYCRPEIDDGAAITIMGGRHPVVEMTSDEPFVPNDVHLSPGELIHILTGPNMSGKSTYLRQTALITLLAQIGSFVPATAAQIGVVDRIFTRIGASDELHRGQSTFMVEMIETANILNHATERSLLILDEIGRGTSTYDGLAIAWAVVEHIHNSPSLRAKTQFATHYHELTDLADRLPQIVNYNVAVDDSGDDVVFLRRILPGRADRSYGVHVAQMAGLPRGVVRRAGEILLDLEASGAAGPSTLLDQTPGRKQKDAMQVGLFALDHPVVESLRALDVDALSPLDALNRLYELRQLAESS